jgi:hypothetical protein
LLAGFDCETDSSAFSWPLDPAIQGLRTVVPGLGVVSKPITVFLREALSGTYNTTNYTEVKIYGNNGSRANRASATVLEATPYIDMETNVVLGSATSNPLNQQCPLKYVGPGEPADVEGFRVRGIGTGEVTNGATGSAVGEGVLNTPDSMAYLFFSFGNVSKMATAGTFPNKKFGYLMIDGVDPLFDNYGNCKTGDPFPCNANGISAGVGAVNPGQPASDSDATTWGELPACGGAGQPACTVSGIWGANPSYPHIRDGSYPSWSELRLMCDPADPQLAVSRCTTANDPLGAEALVINLQTDIHGSHLGGVPDLLPFNDGPAIAGFPNPYGDVSFIRSHYNIYGPNDTDNAFGQGGLPTGAPWQRTVGVQISTSTHQGGDQPLTGHTTDPTVFVNFGTEACTAGGPPQGNPANGPTPLQECGGDAGGLIIPVGNTTLQALQ